jgi:hypothetical protein
MMIQERYSPTPWPGTTLPPAALAVPVSIQERAGGWLVDCSNQGWPIIEAPEELHLREYRDVDPHSPADLLDFVRQTGFPLDPRAPLRGILDNSNRKELSYQQAVNNAARANGLPEFDLTQMPTMDDAVHVAEVAYRVDRVRVMTDHLLRAQDDKPTVTVWRAADFMTDSLAAIHDVQSQEELAWRNFCTFLNAGLSLFSAKVVPRGVDHRPVASSYEVACLKIYNDVVSGLPLRRCADETCRRLFVRQVGRAQLGEYRSQGVIYCSPLHARNQAQRERRRAARIKKAEG